MGTQSFSLLHRQRLGQMTSQEGIGQHPGTHSKFGVKGTCSVAGHIPFYLMWESLLV